MTVQTALLQGTVLLEDAEVPVPRLTAEVLLGHVIHGAREYLLAHPERELDELEWLHYGRYLHDRLNGKPTQYITGRQEFFGRDFRVTPDVLIPRPETEHVVEAALALARGARRALDIGTGSGALAVTLSQELFAEVWATDISPDAALVAADNALRLSAPVNLVVCDLMEAIAPQSMELIVSNPPYVPEPDRASLAVEVRDYEPTFALFAGNDGLDVIHRLVPAAIAVLDPGGALFMEFGYGQRPAVDALLAGAGYEEIEFVQDLQGIPRVAMARKP